jgi:hypothetical protein
MALRQRSDPQERYIDDLPVWLAWAKAEMGALDEAGALIARAIASIRVDNRRLVLVDALRVQALVALKQERWTEAESALAEGLAVARDIGHPYAEARLLYVSGLWRVQQGRPEDAHVPLQEAQVIFERLGARLDVGLVEQALGAVQGEPPRHGVPVQSRQGLRREQAAGGRLARRERQAWALECLRATGSLSPGAYAQGLAISTDTALLDLRELVARGLVRAEGATRNRRYVLAGESSL